MRIHIHQAKAQQGHHTYKTVQDSASAVSNSNIALHHHREELETDQSKCTTSGSKALGLCLTSGSRHQETFLPGDPENSFSWGYFVALKGEPSSAIVTGMVSANFGFSKRAEGNLSLKKEGRRVLSFSKSLECERIEEKVHETGTFTRCASVRLSRVTFDFSMSSKVCVASTTL